MFVLESMTLWRQGPQAQYSAIVPMAAGLTKKHRAAEHQRQIGYECAGRNRRHARRYDELGLTRQQHCAGCESRHAEAALGKRANTRPTGGQRRLPEAGEPHGDQ